MKPAGRHSTQQPRTPGCHNFNEILELGQPQDFARLQELATGVQPDNACNIQFTSGTTGSPKGATLSHFNILNNGYFVARAIELTENDRMLLPVPVYPRHCHGKPRMRDTRRGHGLSVRMVDPVQTLEAIQADCIRHD